jgi:hypothetical protein
VYGGVPPETEDEKATVRGCCPLYAEAESETTRGLELGPVPPEDEEFDELPKCTKASAAITTITTITTATTM